MTFALSVSNLSHRYGERDALGGVSFDVGPGEIFGLLGPNGGGKTTLFKIVSTLLSPSGGTATVFGDDVSTAPDRVRRQLGVVFQAPALDQRLTVRENLTCHGHLFGIRGRELRTRVARTLETVGLADRGADQVATLSGGMQRRVEVAKALVPRPRVLVLDEPSTGLDPRARRELWTHLLQLRQDAGTTVLLTTHLMDEAAGCDRVGIIDRGRLVAIGAPDELTATVGGDVLWIDTAAPDALAVRLAERFGLASTTVDGRLRVERDRGHEFIPRLIEAFPGEISALTYSRPTLEDVFVHQTGRRLE